ncbi:hypothetical protein [Motilimonas eburnea]|uniref:hypothetical protein n=1 Tax=Motilimonas eburnea TaxID=1737488 RepID=UPI001E3689E2|nr:hypothetical protein [Motilimonas eburnea]MCE2573340.1 hypothetical protein [Motilimonas eburnea]
MKLNDYHSIGIQAELAQLKRQQAEANAAQSQAEAPQAGLVKPDSPATTLPETDQEEAAPSTRETILEGIQRVKQSMAEVRYNTSLTSGEKDDQLKPLQQELDELVNEMQLAIKDYANQQADSLFGGAGAGTSRQVGTLFDFLA